KSGDLAKYNPGSMSGNFLTAASTDIRKVAEPRDATAIRCHHARSPLTAKTIAGKSAGRRSMSYRPFGDPPPFHPLKSANAKSDGMMTIDVVMKDDRCSLNHMGSPTKMRTAIGLNTKRPRFESNNIAGTLFSGEFP